MMKDKILLLLMAMLLLPQVLSAGAGGEVIFAGYFDIPTGSREGTEVIGRIHLERNKDVLTRPIPAGYHFEIVHQNGDMFNLETRYDLSKRIMGVLTVAKGQVTDNIPSDHHLTVALKDGDKSLNQFDINVHVVNETLWSVFNRRYTHKTLENKRLYGRIKYNDDEVAAKIEELKNNGWRFAGLEKCYSGRPEDYGFHPDPTNSYAPTGTIEYDWVQVVNQIGSLGYSYATSKVYGRDGDPRKRRELRDALYQAILTYTKSVPVEGSDMLVDGKPIGDCTGDGFVVLQAHKMAGMQVPTHQWDLTDGLMVPVLHLMPDIIEGMHNNDEMSLKVHDALIRYLQVFFAEIKSRRAIDDPDGRWGELQDTVYSDGAWADANLGHRSRTLLALPIIWADYNRPLTYVQYWYSDYYHDKPFKGFSFSPGWSPRGIVSDLSRWMTKYNVPARKYLQSGYQPDGTISHHVDNGTDAVMVAYGFEWLTDCNAGYAYFKDTPFQIEDKYYQFQLDRLLRIYPRMFYKQRMDFLVSGRSFLDDLNAFATRTYPSAVKAMLAAANKNSRLEGIGEIEDVCRRVKDNTWECSGTDAYWVNEYLVHRRGENEKPFYASLKLKSERTVGAEDFSKTVRRAWHMGYGILPVKVAGDEYSDKVLRNYDWHALPGLTEEWRTDPMPLGHAQLSLPGLNKISGVLADGKAGMGIYHHLPRETYSSATAFKSYHFIEDKVIAIGSGIGRMRPGQGCEITTFVDQTAHNGPLTWCAGGETHTVEPGESVDITQKISDVCWLHHGDKGYVVIPVRKVGLKIKTGSAVNITDRSISDDSPNYIIALSHGSEPGQERDNAYRYIQVPNVGAQEMPARVKAIRKELEFAIHDGLNHAVYSDSDKIWQYAFFAPGSVTVGGTGVTSDDVAQIMLRDCGSKWKLSVNNPASDGEKQSLSFTTTAKLHPGVYRYYTAGMVRLEGETVTVSPDGVGSRVTVELPDKRDAARYNYQSDLYAATPIVVDIPK